MYSKNINVKYVHQLQDSDELHRGRKGEKCDMECV